jgi:PilZ domain
MNNLAKKFFDKRSITRYRSAEEINVKIVFSSKDPSLLGKTLKAKAIDISKSSLRLDVTHAISIDSVLDIVIETETLSRKYFITGNVKWRLPAKPGHYQIGLKFRERTDTVSDLSQWKSQFKENFTMD